MSDSLYERIAKALALLIYRRCIDVGDGLAVYEHYKSNRLDIPADILARLGVMFPLTPDEWLCSQIHAFSNGWTPANELVLKRHIGEPSIFDLIVALCLFVDWEGQYMADQAPYATADSTVDFPILELRDHRRFQSPYQERFNSMAFGLAAAIVAELGLGKWDNDGSFSLIYSLEDDRPIDLADTYQETRHLMAERLGGLNKLFPPE